MDFKNVTIQDKSIMDKYLRNNPYGICDYSFSNIFIWQETYGTKYCIHKDFLILQTASSQGEPSFLMPLGEGNLQEIVMDMMNFAKEKCKVFRLTSLTPRMVKELSGFMPREFFVSNEDEFCDYIYLSENMIHLKGKKLSAKRNHINKFLSLYAEQYEYVEIDKNNVHLCKEMNIKWCKERNCGKTDSDFCAVVKALDNLEELGLSGGALIVNGEMVAFTLGQPNNHETYDVIIEKALSHVEGAYPMINREFATKNCGKFLFINREEDMGIEGLKKAKLSYYPYLQLEKGNGVC